jgi:hypothetical protein
MEAQKRLDDIEAKEYPLVIGLPSLAQDRPTRNDRQIDDGALPRWRGEAQTFGRFSLPGTRSSSILDSGRVDRFPVGTWTLLAACFALRQTPSRGRRPAARFLQNGVARPWGKLDRETAILLDIRT